MNLTSLGTVVLVDSDVRTSHLIEQWFVSKKIPIIVYYNAKKAIYDLTSEECPIKQVSLIITEMFLPGQLSGKEVVDILRSRYPESQCLIVVNRPIKMDSDFLSKQLGYRFVASEFAPDTLKTIIE
jgi:hypothetical protein